MDFLTLSEHIINQAYLKHDDTYISFSDEPLKSIISPNEKELVSYFSRIGYPFKDSSELSTFVSFVHLLLASGMKESDLSYFTEGFSFGYKIPQIGKEFDLIRFGDNFNISIELKSSASFEKQNKQLIRNHFYLNFLSNTTKYFSLSLETGNYLEFDPTSNKTKTIEIDYLINALKTQESKQLLIDEIDALFDIKRYLVSPFNNIDKFLNQQYFLNGNQEDIVKYVLNPRHGERLFSIKGNPGTGKTLLTYHIAKILTDSKKKVVIIHGANLNSGQEVLNSKGFSIHPIRNLMNVLHNSEQFDYIIIDEAQRLQVSRKQVSKLFECFKKSEVTKFIISLDGNQTLNKSEDSSVAEAILNEIDNLNGKKFSLKDKFRTNPEMSLFIKNLFKFSIDKPIEKSKNPKRNIQIKYFSNRNAANEYLIKMENFSDWHVLNYSKSSYSKEELQSIIDCGKVAHEVIGQEFDKVIIPMDYNFSYKTTEQEIQDDDGKTKIVRYKFLSTTESYYPIKKMLYQNITRTREMLQLVIIENVDLYLTICELLEAI